MVKIRVGNKNEIGTKPLKTEAVIQPIAIGQDIGGSVVGKGLRIGAGNVLDEFDIPTGAAINGPITGGDPNKVLKVGATGNLEHSNIWSLADGKIGVGISPTKMLQVHGDAVQTVLFRSSHTHGVELNLVGSNNWGVLSTDADSVHGTGKFLLMDENIGAARMSIIRTSGWLGVNTTAPLGQHHTKAGSPTTIGQIIELAAAHAVNAFEINTLGGSGGDLFKFDKNGLASFKENIDFTVNRVAANTFYISNQNAGADAHARMALWVGNTGGDAYTWYSNNINDWSVGMDNSDSDSFVIGKASTIGSNIYLKIKTTGVINMVAMPTSSAGLSSGDLWNNSGVVTIV